MQIKINGTVHEGPSSIAEAESWIVQLGTDIETIQFQLGDKNRTNDDGERLSDHEYFEWQKRARGALLYKKDQHRKLKLWVKERRQAEQAEALGRTEDDDALGLLLKVYGLHRRLMAERRLTRLYDDEQAMMDGIRDWLRAQGVM